jgi:hypothetical protein
MKGPYYICHYRKWHRKGVRCVCGIKSLLYSERKCH